MITASTHAKHARHSLTESALWVLWQAARWTGLAALIHAVRHGISRVKPRRPLRKAMVTLRAWSRCVGVRAQLASNFLTGPAAALTDTLSSWIVTRLRRHGTVLAIGLLMIANLLYLAMR